MRIGITSDLHLEHDAALVRGAQTQASEGLTDGMAIRWWQHLLLREASVGHPRLGPDLAPLRGVDLILMAGDIWKGVQAIAYAQEVSDYIGCPVVVVAGNHDFYGLEMTEATRDMTIAASETKGRVSFLDDTRADFDIDGRRIAVLGSTLWTDYDLLGNDKRASSMKTALNGLNDHNCIACTGMYFQPRQALELHHRSRAWLADEVPKAVKDADVTIVVTHHGVVPEANPPVYRQGNLAPAFSSEMVGDIRRWDCDLVASGHTHHPLDMTIGRTRIVSSPRGYIGTEPTAARYVPLVVEL